MHLAPAAAWTPVCRFDLLANETRCRIIATLMNTKKYYFWPANESHCCAHIQDEEEFLTYDCLHHLKSNVIRIHCCE